MHKTKTLRMLLPVWLTVCSPMWAQTKPATPAPTSTAGQEAAYAVPLVLFHGRPLVNVMINGHGPFKLVLDTGASDIVLDDRLTAELNIQKLGKASITGPDGKEAMDHQKIRIAELRLGPARIADFEAASTDFSGMFRDADSPRGVLSGTAFPGSVITIDYPHSELRVRAGSLPAADSATIFDYELMDELPAVSASLAGQTLRLHIDTGSPAGITLGGNFMKTIPLVSEPEVVGRARLVSGEVKVWGGQLKGTFRLGAIMSESPDIEFLESVPYGNLGYRFLRDYSLSIDAASHRIQLSKN
jgi:Aspartyl protease